MLQNIYYSKESGQAVQVISRCRILPDETEAVCFQEMSGAFPVYVMERRQFLDRYQSASTEGKEQTPEQSQEEVSDLIRFLDADTYEEKIKILESMKENLNEHLLNNMAVSLDLSIEDGVDGYSFLMSELKIRRRFEGKRGDRL